MYSGSTIVYENGDIETTQGDSFPLLVEGLYSDKNYELYYSIYDSKGRIKGDEVHISTGGASSVVLEIPSNLTDLLTVKGGIDSTEDYYQGLKICDPETGYEETLRINGKALGELSVITVHPKKTEGI